MPNKIERRKDTIRRVWDYTTREHFLDADKQFQIEIESVKLSLEMVPDDICAQFSPEFFNRFSKPFNNHTISSTINGDMQQRPGYVKHSGYRGGVRMSASLRTLRRGHDQVTRLLRLDPVPEPGVKSAFRRGHDGGVVY